MYRFVAFDDVYSNVVQQRTSYTYDEILFGRKFVQMYRESSDGKTTIVELHSLDEHREVNSKFGNLRCEIFEMIQCFRSRDKGKLSYWEIIWKKRGVNEKIIDMRNDMFRFHFSCNAQNYPADHDTSYYETYRSLLTARTYLSRKYNVLSFNSPPPAPSFQYRATTSLNLGIGATYHAFTLNIGIGITKFNPNDEKGDTRYLDLQGHFYARKWNIDLLGEFYKGYYLTPKGMAAAPGKPYYLRPDMG